MQIPIQNVYYLLCYAWEKPEQKDYLPLDLDSGAGLIDLFAKLLLNSTKGLLKRGLEQSYIRVVDEIAGLRGKLEIGETVKSNLLNRQKTICSFDEFSPDILNNRILFTTLKKLTKVNNLNSDIKKKIMNISVMFPRITPIKITDSLFKNLKFHRNNRVYEFPLNICRIINENLLPEDTDGNYKFVDFRLNDRKMNKIYEKFLFYFYSKEQSNYKVAVNRFDWLLKPKKEGMDAFLPQMETDITLSNREKKIIIDAKYYKETLTIDSRWGTKKINSANLYQIFSYLINQEKEDDPRTISAKGILLYPTITEEYHLSYSYKNHEIQIKTINLNLHWEEIHNNLLEIILS